MIGDSNHPGQQPPQADDGATRYDELSGPLTERRVVSGTDFGTFSGPSSEAFQQLVDYWSQLSDVTRLELLEFAGELAASRENDSREPDLNAS